MDPRYNPAKVFIQYYSIAFAKISTMISQAYVYKCKTSTYHCGKTSHDRHK